MKLVKSNKGIFLGLVSIFTILLLSNCSSTSNSNGLSATTLSQAQYAKIVEQQSQRRQKYDGLQNTLEVSATFLSTEVIEAQLKFNRGVFQWTDAEYGTEREKKLTAALSQTEVFLSFYTPDKKHDNLSKSKSTWKIFLDAHGKRYEAKVEKISSLPAEVQSLYPLHNRFSTPYRLIFPVATATTESSSPRLTLTGPIDTVVLEFK